MKQLTLTEVEFERVSKTAYRLAGLHMSATKRSMVSGRLRQRLRATGLASFDVYLDMVDRSAPEQVQFVDVLTTNETRFYREQKHFDLLESQVWPKSEGPIKVWSAASSTGEEPYSIAISLLNTAPKLAASAKILATDIAPSVLESARRGVFSKDRTRNVPKAAHAKYFRDFPDDPRKVELVPQVKRMVKFARLNLMSGWPMSGGFDLILLRNVMIYFDAPTRAWLGRRMATMLAPGGFLFIGHAESLGDNAQGLSRVQPAVYRRNTEAVRVGLRKAS